MNLKTKTKKLFCEQISSTRTMVSTKHKEVHVMITIGNLGSYDGCEKGGGEEQGSKSPFSLLSEPISPSSLLFISSSRSIQFNSPFSQLFFFSLFPTFPPISPSFQLSLGHFSLLPILFLPPLKGSH